jgi:APA family basic amino acid/polyamine antiporter
MSGSKPKVFVRDATGLVREISSTSAFIANLSFINIALGILTYTSASFVFPGSDPVQATIIATLFCICVSLMYTLFTWAMPRSGGDYILMSRVLHPLIGFVANFNVTFWYIFFIGIATNWVTTFSISPAILIVGNVTGNQSLIGLANTLAQPQNIVLVGIVVVIFNAALMIRGVRATFTLNNIMFLISIAGVGVMLWLLIINTNATFTQSFNRFADYGGILQAAHNEGYSPQGPNPFVATLGVMPYIFASTGYGIITSYFAGEVKEVKKNAFISQVIATAVGGAMLAVLGALAINVFGYDFLGSITMLATTGAKEYPFSVPPYFNLFVTLLTDNPTLIWFLAISFVAAIIIAFPPTYMLATRNIFAWSFDRVIPTRFSTINERFHTPIYAIIVVAILQFIALVAYTYGSPTFIALSSGAGMAEILSFMVVAIAAIVFPFRRKDIYGRSPANINLGRIPLITIAGVVSLIFYLMLEYFYFTNSLYGANTIPVFITTAVSLILPAVIFIASYYYSKSRGLDLSLAFKDLPPE